MVDLCFCGFKTNFLSFPDLKNWLFEVMCTWCLKLPRKPAEQPPEQPPEQLPESLRPYRMILTNVLTSHYSGPWPTLPGLLSSEEVNKMNTGDTEQESGINEACVLVGRHGLIGSHPFNFSLHQKKVMLYLIWGCFCTHIDICKNCWWYLTYPE